MNPWIRNLLIGLGVVVVGACVSAWAVSRSWRRAFDEEVRRLEQSGAPVAPSQLAPPPVPDGENAAPLIVEAAALLDALKDEEKAEIDDLPDGEGLDTESLKPYLEKCRAALDRVTEAVRRPRCRFPVNYEAGSIEADLSSILSLVHFARLLNARAVLSLRSGDGRAAVRDVRTILRLSDCLSGEPFQLGQMMRHVVVGRAFDVLKRDRLALPDREWSDLAKAFEKQAFGDGLARAYAMERASAIDVCRKYYFAGKVPAGSNGSTEAGWFAEHLAARSARKYFREIGGAIELARKPYPEAMAAEVALLRESEQSRSAIDILSLVFLPAVVRFHQAEATAEAQCRMAAAFCRIKAGGKSPESLEETDPCTGKPFLYRRRDAGFEIRSPGPNQKDDGGAEDDLVLKSGK